MNAVVVGMRVELGDVAAVNARFRSRQSPGVLAPQLARSEKTLALLGERLAALRPPPQAKPVAATLARYVALAGSLVSELHRFALFLPAFDAAVKQSARAGAAFRRAASTVKTLPTEAAAVTVYAAALAAPIAALARISPPDVLRPTYVSEVHVLRSSRATALALAAALQARQTAKAQALVLQLARDSAGNASVETQRAEIAAVRAYDAQVAEIGRLQTLAQQQLATLQNS